MFVYFSQFAHLHKGLEFFNYQHLNPNLKILTVELFQECLSHRRIQKRAAILVMICKSCPFLYR